MCLLEHVGMVYNKYSCDDHGLKQEDISKKDRQNWALAQCICQKKVRLYLSLLRCSRDVHREQNLGTKTYL